MASESSSTNFFSNNRPDSGSIVAEMQRIAPPGLADADIRAVQGDLSNLTALLLGNEEVRAKSEYSRFLSIRNRSLTTDMAAMQAHIKDKRILVTGGTGCIGQILLSELITLAPSCIVSLGSSGVSDKFSGVESVSADVSNADDLKRTFASMKPDIVYHLAAERKRSGTAKDLQSTLTTNILGTHNVIEAAEEVGVSHLVYASTDKALLPFVGETYGISKKAGEWLMSEAALRENMLCTAVRLAHVADNSVVFERLHHWAYTDSVIRLYNPNISMRVQSAKEAARLLLSSVLDAEPNTLKIQALDDIGAPISLTRLALGTIAKARSNSPIYFCGMAPGYETYSQPDIFYPSSNRPLIGRFEASARDISSFCSTSSTFPLEMESSRAVKDIAHRLETNLTNTMATSELKTIEDTLAWSMFDARVAMLNRATLNTALRQLESMVRTPMSSRMKSAIFAAIAKQTN